MGVLEEYSIAITKLKNQSYQYKWKGNDSFFAAFEDSLVKKGSFEVTMHLQKSEVLIQLNFQIKGKMELVCDRSLESFMYPFQTEGRQVLQFSDHDEVVDTEYELITKGTPEINVAQYIYELIMLAIPMKKLHPRFQKTQSKEELKLVYSSTTYSTETETNNASSVDPRWLELKKLLNKNQ